MVIESLRKALELLDELEDLRLDFDLEWREEQDAKSEILSLKRKVSRLLKERERQLLAAAQSRITPPA